MLPRQFESRAAPPGSRAAAIRPKATGYRRSQGNPCLDFFFHVIPDTLSETLTERLKFAWEHDPLKALKLVSNLRVNTPVIEEKENVWELLGKAFRLLVVLNIHPFKRVDLGLATVLAFRRLATWKPSSAASSVSTPYLKDCSSGSPLFGSVVTP
ncbi:hypothetical protein STAS_04684 [Striga asiatica]|uniref:DUF2828 domain-containing protein n=1 Tax=Striga asiatica TaxID=4170 RepID=A0A5A7P881_STRAF|nr:hypothetical protein STAS_04684 [Striga asiatica]